MPIAESLDHLVQRPIQSLSELPKRKVNNPKPKTDHLKAHQWQPGQSGHAAGKPKGTSLTETMRTWLDKNSDQLTEDGKPLTWRQAVVYATLKHACKGNAQALKEVWSRIDGPVLADQQIHTEADLWTRLNDGRLRLAARETTTERVIQVDGVTHERSVTREVTFDAPSEEPGKDEAFAWGEGEST